MNRTKIKIFLRAVGRLLWHPTEIPDWIDAVLNKKKIYVNSLGEIHHVGLDLPYAFMTPRDLLRVNRRIERNRKKYSHIPHSHYLH